MSSDMMIDKFNRIVSNWSLENGYNDGVEKWHYPIRMFNSKQNGALLITLWVLNEHLEYTCTGYIQGIIKEIKKRDDLLYEFLNIIDGFKNVIVIR